MVLNLRTSSVRYKNLDPECAIAQDHHIWYSPDLAERLFSGSPIYQSVISGMVLSCEGKPAR